MKLSRYLWMMIIISLVMLGGYGISLSAKPFNPHEAPNCKSCHELHRTLDGKETLLEKIPNEEEVCFKCHQDPMQSAHGSNVKAEFLEAVSHHPIFDYPAYGPERKSLFKKLIPQQTVPGEIQHPQSEKERQEWPKALKCHNCHNPHKISAKFPLSNPRRPLELWRGTVVDFCLTCHDGTWAVDIKSIYTYRLDRPSAGHRNPRRIPFADPKPCTDCHRPHGSQNARLLKERVQGKEIRVAQDLEGSGAEGFDQFCMTCHQTLAPGPEVPRPKFHGTVISGHSCNECHNPHSPMAPLKHSSDRGGHKWGQYWSNDMEACNFCHGKVTNGLGLLDSFRGTNVIGQRIGGSTWCASCHVWPNDIPGASWRNNYNKMLEIFKATGRSIPPENRSGQIKGGLVPPATFPNFPPNALEDHDDEDHGWPTYTSDFCIRCHNPGRELTPSSPIFLFVHNLPVGDPTWPGLSQTRDMRPGPGSLTLRISPETLEADGRGRARITARLQDTSGKPVAGRELEFSLSLAGDTDRDEAGGVLQLSAVKTDRRGILEAEFLAGSVPHSVLFMVKERKSGLKATGVLRQWMEVETSLTLEGEGNEPSRKSDLLEVKVTPPTLPADGVSTAHIEVLVNNRIKGLPIEDKPRLSIWQGGGMLKVVEDFLAGRMTALYTAPTKPGRAVVVVKYGAVNQYVNINIKASRAGDSSLVVTPETLPADARSRAKVLVILKDETGKAIVGAVVKLSVMRGEGRIVGSAQAVTDSFGQARFQYQAGHRPGEVVLKAKITSPSPVNKDWQENRFSKVGEGLSSTSVNKPAAAAPDAKSFPFESPTMDRPTDRKQDFIFK